MTTNITSSPIVELFTHTGKQFIIHDIVEYQSSRSMDNPVASASFSFMGDRFQDTSSPEVNGKRWDEVLSLYDLCQVRLQGRDGQEYIDGLFLIDVPRTTRRQTVNGPITQTVVSMVSIGEALIRYPIFWHPWLVDRSNIAGLGFLARSKGLLPLGRPHEVIGSIYNAFMNDDYVFTLANGKRLNQSFLLQFEEIKDSLSLVAFSAMGAETALWDTLKRYCDSPWNEFFVDVPHENSNRDVESIYLRPTPFDFDRWDKLASQDGWSFEYDGSDMFGQGEDLGPNARNIHNFFWTSAKMVFAGFDQVNLIRERSGGKLPRYDQGLIKRFGLRKMEMPTEYVQFVTQQQAQTPLSPQQKTRGGTNRSEYWQLLEKRTKQLHLWFGYPNYWEGSLTTVGRIGVSRQFGGRIGGILKNKQDGRNYYINGISQNWSFLGSWSTSFQLSRGHEPKKLRLWWQDRSDGTSIVAESNNGIAFV